MSEEYPFLRVAPSAVPNAGLGTFAHGRDLVPGERFRFHCAEEPVSPWNAWETLPDNVTCDGTLAPVPNPLGRNPALYVNGASTAALCARVNVAVDLASVPGEVWYVVTRPVAEDEEIILDYGPERLRHFNAHEC